MNGINFVFISKDYSVAYDKGWIKIDKNVILFRFYKKQFCIAKSFLLVTT
jgi:hypothetical protein